MVRVRLGQMQQLIRHPPQVLYLTLHSLQDPLVFSRGSLPGQRDVDLGPHECERAPQNLRGVRSELPQALEAFLEPGQHLVESGFQLPSELPKQS